MSLPRLALARLNFTTNLFNPLPVDAAAVRGATPRFSPAGWTAVPLPGAEALAGGPIDDALWDRCVDELLEGLDHSGADALLLELDGAARTARREAPERSLMELLRERLGERPLGLVLGRQANLDQGMTDPVDLALCGTASAQSVADGLRDRIDGGPRLERALARTPFCIPAAAAHALEARWRGIERTHPGIGIFSGYPYTDVPYACASVLAWAPDAEHARAMARAAGQELLGTRGDWHPATPGAHQALMLAASRSRSSGQPEWIVEPADAPALGGCSDTPELLRALFDARQSLPGAFVNIADPALVAQAFSRGTRGYLRCRLGARLSRDYGAALEREFVIERLSPPHAAFGRSAVIVSQGIGVVVSEYPGRIRGTDDLDALGLDVTAYRLVCVKAAPGDLLESGVRNPIACNTAGPAALDLRNLPFTALRPR